MLLTLMILFDKRKEISFHGFPIVSHLEQPLNQIFATKMPPARTRKCLLKSIRDLSFTQTMKKAIIAPPINDIRNNNVSHNELIDVRSSIFTCGIREGTISQVSKDMRVPFIRV